jgi:hypothetical protein
MSAITMPMPSAAARKARLRPMPLAAPVMTALRSVKSFILRNQLGAPPRIRAGRRDEQLTCEHQNGHSAIIRHAHAAVTRRRYCCIVMRGLMDLAYRV